MIERYQTGERPMIGDTIFCPYGTLGSIFLVEEISEQTSYHDERRFYLMCSRRPWIVFGRKTQECIPDNMQLMFRKLESK
jgi:hypothetical protein